MLYGCKDSYSKGVLYLFSEYVKDGLLVSSDRKKIQVDTVCKMLKSSYWAAKRPREVIEKSIENSLCFGIYDGSRQIGFARIITDYSIFSYLCDVYIDEEYRGRGIGKWLVECILKWKDDNSISRMMLSTADAHELYRKFGFKELENPGKMMALSQG